jgi:glycine oxidase
MIGTNPRRLQQNPTSGRFARMSGRSPTEFSPLHPDFLIIGAGVIGYMTARELIKDGATVTILERGLAGREASWAGGGILSPLLSWDYGQAVTQLTEWGRKLYPALAEELFAETGIDPEYRVSGMLVLPEFDATQAKAWCAAYGVPVQEVDSRAIVPSLARAEPALWLPEVAQIRSPRLLRALRHSLEARAVEIHENAEVLAFNTAGGEVVSVSSVRGEFYAKQVIVCAGAWSSELLGPHALELAIKPVRGQMLLFKIPPGVLRAIVLHNDVYLIPRDDGHILVGSSVEEVGFDKSTTSEGRRLLVERAMSLLPELNESSLVGHWAGLRPGAPGNIPIISRHPDLKNLYLNSGHYRYGVTMAPASAKLLANIIFQRAQAIDEGPYVWPARVAAPEDRRQRTEDPRRGRQKTEDRGL